MDPPQNVANLQSFNGMINYLKKFSQVLSEVSEPLRRLCKSGVVWAWELEQQDAFEAIKQVITSLPVLAYFDKTKKHTIQCNACKKGLGAVLLQESKPVMYMSRALTETEQRYSNIERELLAIVFTPERLNHYTFGRTITVQSDHQPLQSIWKKSVVSASPRLQRLLLRLAHYELNIEFLRGKENVIVDALSRVCPLQSTNSKTIDSNIDVIPVHHITQSAPVSKTRLQELRLGTQSDPTLSSLAKTVHKGWPQSKKDCPEQLLDFWSFRQEISEEDGLLYKNHTLKMPYSERLETLKVLHLGHYAIDKMQLRALETVYWPGINKDILKCYQSCKTCIKYSQRNKPLHSHPTPELPWHTVGTDLFETKYSKYILIVDHYSRFPILHKLSSATSRVMIQEVKASLIKTIEEEEDVDLALLTYKTMPLNHRLPSPAELLNSRKYKTLLLTHIVPTRLQETCRQIMDEGKQVQAQQYNRGARVLPRLKQSQKVVVQLDPGKNVWTPAQIVQCLVGEGRSYSLKTVHGGVYTRNRRFIKPDLTEAAPPEPEPEPRLRPLPPRPTRTIKRPDRLIESK